MNSSETFLPTLHINNNQNLQFAYTDNSSIYMMFSSGNFALSDGILSSKGLLIQDFGIKIENKFYPRCEAELIKAELGGFRLSWGEKLPKVFVALTEGICHIQIEKNLDVTPENYNISLVLFSSKEFTECIDKGNTIFSSVDFSINNTNIKNKCNSFSQKTKNICSRIIDFTPSSCHKISVQIKLVCTEEKNFVPDFNLLNTKIESLNKKLSKATLSTGINSLDKAYSWAKYSGYQLLTKEPSYGIWAGLPWFRDNWGRDTFIALSGILLVNGLFDEAKNVIRGFSLYQDKNPSNKTFGRIPNRYDAEGNIIYNNADGTLWFIREVVEYGMYTGDKTFLEEMWPVVKTAINCDISLRTDSQGFLTHGDADTWMDARLKGENAWSPRGNRANDIQGLWKTALDCGIYLAKILGYLEDVQNWIDHSELLSKNFLKKFWDGEKIADCILQDETPDFRCRPNQMFLVTTPLSFQEPLIPTEIRQKITETVTTELIFPYGICSLSQKDDFFHPYHIGCKNYQKDAAYHNGTIWGFNSALAVSFLCKNNSRRNAKELLFNLSDQFFSLGCIGSLSENLNAFPDKNGDIIPTGTWSQAWSVSEFNRSIIQDILGVKPNLLENKIVFSPEIPEDFPAGSAKLPLAQGYLTLRWETGLTEDQEYQRTFYFSGENLPTDLEIQCPDNQLIKLKGSTEVLVNVSFQKDIYLDFAKPDFERKYPCLEKKNFLEKIVALEKYNGHHLPTHTSVH